MLALYLLGFHQPRKYFKKDGEDLHYNFFRKVSHQPEFSPITSGDRFGFMKYIYVLKVI